MTFLPTLTIDVDDLTNPEVAARLTPGQWVRVPCGMPGRFVGLSPSGVVHMYYPETHKRNRWRLPASCPVTHKTERSSYMEQVVGDHLGPTGADFHHADRSRKIGVDAAWVIRDNRDGSTMASSRLRSWAQESCDQMNAREVNGWERFTVDPRDAFGAMRARFVRRYEARGYTWAGIRHPDYMIRFAMLELE